MQTEQNRGVCCLRWLSAFIPFRPNYPKQHKPPAFTREHKETQHPSRGLSQQIPCMGFVWEVIPIDSICGIFTERDEKAEHREHSQNHTIRDHGNLFGSHAFPRLTTKSTEE